MWISIREKFSQDDLHWDKYIAFIGLPALSEVRTIDVNLNSPINVPIFVPDMESLDDAILHLPVFDKTSHYLQIAINCSDESTPDITGMPLKLLGYDLSDGTQISSILNCGQWTGELLPFIDRLNKYGLLSYNDALSAQEILPLAWNDDPHSFVDIWAIYELNQP